MLSKYGKINPIHLYIKINSKGEELDGGGGGGGHSRGAVTTTTGDDGWM